MDLPQAANKLTLQAIGAEVIRARLKFPHGSRLLAALMEECGELANALLELSFNPMQQDQWHDRVQKEAIQVAAVAVRILEEGTPEFPEYRAPGSGK